MSIIQCSANTPTSPTVSSSAPTIQQWIASQTKRITGASADVSEDGDKTSLGDAIQRNLPTQEFLDAGKATGEWFHISPETRAKFIAVADADGEDGPAMLAKLDQALTKLNAMMKRADIDDTVKLSFLQAMMGNPSTEYDDASGDDDAYTGLGTVLAELMAGNVDALFSEDDLEVDDVDQIVSTFEPQASKWMKDNDVSVKEDKSYEYMNTLANDADAGRKRRAQMTPAEAAADIRRENAEMRERYQNQPRSDTPKRPPEAK